jgi:hypothetical protein
MASGRAVHLRAGRDGLLAYAGYVDVGLLRLDVETLPLVLMAMEKRSYEPLLSDESAVSQRHVAMRALQSLVATSELLEDASAAAALVLLRRLVLRRILQLLAPALASSLQGQLASQDSQAVHLSLAASVFETVRDRLRGLAVYNARDQSLQVEGEYLRVVVALLRRHAGVVANASFDLMDEEEALMNAFGHLGSRSEQQALLEAAARLLSRLLDTVVWSRPSIRSQMEELLCSPLVGFLAQHGPFHSLSGKQGISLFVRAREGCAIAKRWGPWRAH